MDGPTITDWIQAVGTIVAIVFSAILSIAVPLWVRYLEIRRYRVAFVMVLIGLKRLCRHGKIMTFPVDPIDEFDMDLVTDTISDFEKIMRDIDSFPFLMMEMPQLASGRDRIYYAIKVGVCNIKEALGNIGDDKEKVEAINTFVCACRNIDHSTGDVLAHLPVLEKFTKFETFYTFRLDTNTRYLSHDPQSLPLYGPLQRSAAHDTVRAVIEDLQKGS